MKVLHVIDSGGMYGAEAMLLNLVAEQILLGFEPVIASIGEPNIPEKPLELEAARRGLLVEKFCMRPGPNICGVLELLRFAWRGKFDLFHSHGYKSNILLGMVPRGIRKTPVISTIHGWTSTKRMSRMGLYEWMDLLSLRFVEGVVLVNDAMRDKVKHRNLHVVNNGIASLDDTDRGRTEDAQNLFGDEIAYFCRGGFTIGAIGRLSPEKGFDILINAFKEVRQTIPKARLVILGEGGERKKLELSVRESGLERQVLLPGYLPDAKGYLQFFQLFVLSSLTEGLPIVILEAMQAGVPIVATMVGGVPVALENGNAGMLVEPADSRQLAQGILKMTNEPELCSQFVENARHVVREKYSSSRMAREYQEIYCKILSVHNATELTATPKLT